MNNKSTESVEGEIIPASTPPSSKGGVGVRVTRSVVAGNFLPPQLIEQYAQTEEGRRFLDHYYKQSNHRMGLERTTIDGNNWRANAGLVLAFVLSLCFLVAGVYLAMNNHDWVGGTIIVSSLGTLVGTFIYVTNSRQREREEKNEQISRVLQTPQDPTPSQIPE